MRARVLAWLGLCWLAGCTTDPTRAARSCQSDADCDNDRCVATPQAAPEELAALPLSCGVLGDGHAAGAACEQGSECAAGVCLLAGACARPCASAADCSQAQRCQAVYARAGNTALQSLHACVARVDLPSDATVHSAVLHGAITSPQATLELPGSSRSTLFVLEHLSDDSWPIPDPASTCRPPLCTKTLVSRAAPGTTLFDESAVGSQPAGPINPVANGDHVNPVTVLVPNGPRSQPSAAGYTLQLESKRAGDLRLTTLARSARGQRLDLNVYYVGARDFSRQGDRGPLLLADALGVVDEILGQAEIFIGEVRQIDVRGQLLDEGVPLPEHMPLEETTASQGFSPIRKQYMVYPQLPELWKLSAGAGNVALDLFFVSDIENIGNGDVGAIAGGTPGPLGMHGTAGSGIAIATNMLLDQNDPAALGRTLAHEIGHMLGLFHVVEVDGSVRDPFSDTPACSIDQDANHDGLLEAGECAGAGGDNLMFPTVSAKSTKLSPQQQAILRAALILQ